MTAQTSILKTKLASLAFVILFTTIVIGAQSLLTAHSAFAQYSGFTDPSEKSVKGDSGGLVPVEAGIDGGMVPIGASAQVVIRFRNESGKPLQTGLIRLYPSSTVSAIVSLNQCKEGMLPVDAECAVALSVKGLQSGAWRVEILMSHSGRSRLVSATVSGQVEAGVDGSSTLSSDIEAIPNKLDFGSLSDGQTLIEPIIFRNNTSAPLEISDMYIDSSEQAGYSIKTECKTLEAGEACIAIISWSPRTKGRSSGVLVVKHNGLTALTSVPLSGEFTPDSITEAEIFPSAQPGMGLLVSSQTELDFGSDVESASSITVSLVNAGDNNLTIGDIKIAGSDNGLNFKEGGCAQDMVLKPIQACPLTVTWSPTRVGSLFDDVQITHSGTRGVLILPVRGEASSTVSQDQRAIVISSSSTPYRDDVMDDDDYSDTGGQDIIPASEAPKRERQTLSVNTAGMKNLANLLDGYKITSFSANRAIINGPGGSRLVFDGEEAVVGGVPWLVIIQRNGIEFLYEEDRVLLLFDRSLSTINRVSSSSSSNTTSSTSGANNSDNGG